MPLPQSPSLIVFDKDGVLVDLNRTWMPLIVGLAEHLVERGRALGDTSLRRDVLLEAVGVEMRPDGDEGRILEDGVLATGTFTSMAEAWQATAPSLAPVFADVDSYHAEVRRLRGELMQGNTIPKGERVAATLSRMKDAGWTLAIATNDTKNSTRINLEDIGIADKFDAVICCDSGFGSKPDPDGLLEACRVTGCRPEDSIMVGDTRVDWQAAQNAGFGGFIAIVENTDTLPHFIPSADAVLPDISGIPDLLSEAA